MTVEPEELGQSGEELAALLKAVRKRSGLAGARVAARCNMSQSKVSRIENGKVRPSLVDVEQLLRACDAPPTLVTQVMTLARLANTEWQGARGMRRKGLDKKQLELAGLEASSAEFRFFLLSMITGLLSTPEYIRASLAHVPGDHAKTIARKLERQQVLYDRSKRFTFILTEQAVRWPLVGPDALAVQIDHLASLTHLPNVRLGVIPITVPTGPAPLNTFTIYDDRMATVELSSGVMVFRDPRDVIGHLQEFSHLEERAVFGEDARAFFRGCAAALR
ncbi:MULTISPECIES: helix-turn-helix domain-containing protein [Streptomyces]|uniref:Helix-turn-helix transcriptional regulator n=1 Tax=Streptomyces katrae TaxID=68223 RepID=A0ABT7GVR8_9ACTN|nr:MULTISPECIES: helix-turn-helix transcriptional regulator [Streptomyces]MDK9497692.1 helix-turn-helix transcriptional regulator [Streptomyces katrae]GLX18931.1 transcriptional regulator [Streptomyces lavendulae subsp. lavendulae]GLX29147.1 transcriptional regulator [Streptomyces lavendulae subsp. lavendulae]